MKNVPEKEICREWEGLKQQVKIEAIERACEIKREERRVENGLRLDLQRLLDEERITPCIFKDDIVTIKANLEKIDEERDKVAIVRARAEKLLVGETPTKRAFALETKYASGNQIEEIEYHGTVTGNRDLIKQAFVEYYQTLFGRKTKNEKRVSQ